VSGIGPPLPADTTRGNRAAKKPGLLKKPGFRFSFAPSCSAEGEKGGRKRREKKEGEKGSGAKKVDWVIWS